MAYDFFSFSAADGGATTLTGLLNSSTTSSSEADNATTTSVSLTYAYEDGELLRTALKRNKDERNESEERWVCYSEVVERRSEEEVTSSSVAAVDDRKKLDLKLDYEEIMNAWCDRGRSLYIHDAAAAAGDSSSSPQIVPDVSNDDHVATHETSYGLQDCWGSNNMGLWKVPEMKTNGDVRREEEGQVGDESKQATREASVLRYKEKRQNRLFAKRIRYEVRKLNAEKRPRVKGRFVKRS